MPDALGVVFTVSNCGEQAKEVTDIFSGSSYIPIASSVYFDQREATRIYVALCMCALAVPGNGGISALSWGLSGRFLRCAPV